VKGIMHSPSFCLLACIFQGIANPCPRVKHPDWLARKVAALSSRSHQQTLKDMFPKLAKKTGGDMEDMAGPSAAARPGRIPAANVGDGDPEGGDGCGGVQMQARRGARGAAAAIARSGSSSDSQGGIKGGELQQQENADPNAVAVAVPQSGAKRPLLKPSLASDGYQAWMRHQKTQWRQVRRPSAARRDAMRCDAMR
jgi:DNA polymerase epsilon subunit 1